MPTSRTTSEQWSNQEQDAQSSSRQTTSISVAGASDAEKLLQGLAMQIYERMANDALGSTLTPESIIAGGVTDAERSLVADWQRSTMDAARSGMMDSYREQDAGLAAAMASRGVLDSTAYGAGSGMIARNLQQQYGAMAAQSQAQAAQQLMSLSQNRQQIGMQLYGMNQQAAQFAASPQLLRDLMDFRLRTGATTSTGFGSETSSSSGYGFGKEVAKEGTNWAGLITGLAGAGAMAYAGRKG